MKTSPLISAIRPALLGLFIGLVSIHFASTNAQGAAIASDSASNYTTATWVNGANFGTGFGAWTIPTAVSDSSFQKAIESSSINGGTSNIDTGGVAFRIRRNGGFNQVLRSFTIGGDNDSDELAVGQSFKFSLDFESFGLNQNVGFWLTDAGNGERWGLQYTGGTANLILKTNGGSNQDTGISVSGLNEGFNVVFTLGNAGAWAATVEKQNGDGTFNLSSSTFGTVSASPTGFRFFVAGNGANLEHYLNKIEIVPEPSSLALVGLGAAFMMRRKRRIA